MTINPRIAIAPAILLRLLRQPQQRRGHWIGPGRRTLETLHRDVARRYPIGGFCAGARECAKRAGRKGGER